VDETQRPNLSPAETARLEALGRIIDEAQRQLRDGKVSPELLADLGMTQEEFRAFVEKYSQRLDRVGRDAKRRGTDAAGSQGQVDLPGRSGLQKGRGPDGKLLDPGDGEQLTPDELRKLYESRAAEVPPEYRRQVEAYFRALSEMNAPADPTGSTTAPAK